MEPYRLEALLEVWPIELHKVWPEITDDCKNNIPNMSVYSWKKKRGKHTIHLTVPETFKEKMSIIDGTQYDRAEHRQVFRCFCHLCEGPCWQNLLYIKFPRMWGKKCPSVLLQRADILDGLEKRMGCEVC